jgi:peptidoglycan/LPS O-acetylase OafA/YrhL
LEAQIISVLRRPAFGVSGVAVAAALSLVFLYFDEFYFVSPYPVFYLDPGRLPIFLLDVTISALSGIVLALSAYEVRTFPRLKGAHGRTGFLGIAAAFIAGACPCYYLVPLLAIAGGAGGALATMGILFYDYQIPIKLGSMAILIFTVFVQERSLKAACELPGERGNDGLSAADPPRIGLRTA